MRGPLTLLALTASLCCLGPVQAAPKHEISKSVVTNLRITGMDCESCAGGVVNQLKKLKGVKTAKVDAKTRKGTVEYDPSVCKPADLVQRVKVAGFQASVIK